MEPAAEYDGRNILRIGEIWRERSPLGIRYNRIQQVQLKTPFQAMTLIQPKRKPRRGRLFPEYTIPPEELARREAEKEARCKRGRVIFEGVRLASYFPNQRDRSLR